MRLKDKAAIVTGAGSGLGKSIAETFADEKARVAVLDIDQEKARYVAKEIGSRAIAIRCDVTRRKDIEHALSRAFESFGRIDILVNNAGVTHSNKSMLEISEGELDRVLAVNVKGV